MIPNLDRATAEDLASLDERLGLLLPVRVGLAAGVILIATFAPSELGSTWSAVALPSACYLLVAAVTEWLALRRYVDRVGLHRLLVPIDAVFLVWTTVPVGGAVRAPVLLLAVHLVAVTLLASVRSGLRLSLWDAGLLVAARVPWTVATVARIRGVQAGPVPRTAETVIAVAGLVAVALCAGFFSTVSERELRRAKTELRSLATMGAELEQHPHAGDILAGLLTGLDTAFRFDRVAALWDDEQVVEVRTLDGPATSGRLGAATSPLRSLLGRTRRRAARPGRPGPSAPELPVSSGWADAVAAEVWATRSPVLIRSLDPEANPELHRLLPRARHVVVLPLGPDGAHRGVVALALGAAPLGQRLPRRTLIALTQFSAHASLALRNARLMAEREQLARRDALTGLANRRHFDEVLASEVDRAHRSGDHLSLVLLDIDRFKQVNDLRGHQAGDEVLKEVGRQLASTVRQMDTAARYGGEEFALVLPACGVDGALRVAEAARAGVAASAALDGLTVSAGVAVLPRHAVDGLGLVRAADAALYRSKREGRDRVTISDVAVPVEG